MSEQVADVKIDKSAWGDGPWQTEPDRVQWEHAGYACLIVRNDRYSGHWCGYVGVDRAHPYHGKDYGECDGIDVHGGLTYADECNGSICHVPAPGMPADVWWLGFDAAHFGDLAPGMRAFERSIPALEAINEGRKELCGFEDTYRDEAYMRAQTEALAEQLRAKAEAK